MALATGLRVVKRAEAVRNLLDLVKLRLIHGVRGVVHHPVGLVVKAGGRFGKGRTRSTKTKNIDRSSKHEHTQKGFHEHLEAGGQGECNPPSGKNKVEKQARFCAFS